MTIGQIVTIQRSNPLAAVSRVGGMAEMSVMFDVSVDNFSPQEIIALCCVVLRAFVQFSSRCAHSIYCSRLCAFFRNHLVHSAYGKSIMQVVGSCIFHRWCGVNLCATSMVSSNPSSVVFFGF